MTNQTRTIINIAAAAIIVFGVGCSSDKDKKSEAFQDPFFPPREATPALTTMMQRQNAIAAAEDGMLFDIHFDGTELNALGQQKLDLMIEGKSKNAPLKLFLNMPKDGPDTAARQTNIETALRDSALETNQFAIAVGPNPGVLRSAEAGVRALDLQRGNTGDASSSAKSVNLPLSQGE